MTDLIQKFYVELSLYNIDTGDSDILNNTLKEISISYDYSKNSYPLYQLILNLTQDARDYIIKNNVNFLLKIFLVDMNSESVNNDYTSETMSKPALDKIIITENLRPLDKSILSAKSKISSIDDDEENTTVKNQFFTYTLYCVPEDKINYNNSIINECYENVSLNEAILNIISSNYSEDIYLQESTNITRYQSLLVPQMNFINALRFINDAYGLYKNEFNIFFDEDKLYVYDICEQNREFTNYLNIEIKYADDNSNQKAYENAHYEEDDNKIIIYLKNIPTTFNNHDVYRDTTGNNHVSNSYDDNFNIVSRSYSLEGKDKTRYVWNTQKDKVFETKHLYDIYIISSIVINAIDPTMINPGTKITISGGDISSVNGQYALLNKLFICKTTDFVNYTGQLSLGIGELQQNNG